MSQNESIAAFKVQCGFYFMLKFREINIIAIIRTTRGWNHKRTLMVRKTTGTVLFVLKKMRFF